MSTPKPEMSLRPLTEDDLPQLVEIERRVHVAPWTEENFRAEIFKPYAEALVLTDDETDTQILAYIVFWLLFEELSILNVAVDLPYRGLGHAKRMVQKAVAMATRKNVKRAVLDVRKSNTPAIQLYQGLGFSITQMRKGFYSNGEDAYQLSLDLTGPRVEF